MPTLPVHTRDRRGPAPRQVLAACTVLALRRANRRDRGRDVGGPSGHDQAIPTTSRWTAAAATGTQYPRSAAAGTAIYRAWPTQPAPGGQWPCACAVAAPKHARGGRSTAVRPDFCPAGQGERADRRAAGDAVGGSAGPPGPFRHAERGACRAYGPSGALDPALRARAQAKRRQGRESSVGTALTARRRRPPRAAFCRAAGPTPARGATRARGPRGAYSARAIQSRR